jgi:hypothetical protein
VRTKWWKAIPGWGWVLGGTVAGWALLQVCRPRFFLTDDTFSLFFPIWVSVGRALREGRPFWICEELFGGGYNLAADSQMIPLWHPVAMVLSLLGDTPLESWMADLLALMNLLLASAGFYYLIRRLERCGLAAGPPWLKGLVALSWTFSMYVLQLGSSGIWYLANVAALPWMVGAVCEERPRRACLVMALAVFHGAVGGYPSCFIYSMISLGIPMAWRLAREPRWVCRGALPGVLLGGMMALPFLLPALLALPASVRGGAIPVEVASECRYPLPVLLASLFGGSLSARMGEIVLFGKMAHAYALGVSAVAGLAVLGLWRGVGRWSSWDGVLGVGWMLALVLVSRPDVVGEVIHHLPVLSSLRWPHKEMFLAVFWLHLMALRGTQASARLQAVAAGYGVAVWALPLLLAGMPSLNEHALSRALYLSGEARRHWEAVRALNPPILAPALEDDVAEDVARYPEIPWILLGSHNFPAWAGVRSWTGYSATLPQQLFQRQPPLANVYGALALRHADAYAAATGGGWLLLYDPSSTQGWRWVKPTPQLDTPKN